MEFFDEIVTATKQAQDETVQLEKDAGVLFKHLERKIKGIIRSRANLGYTDVIVDIGNINVDLMSKWSIKDLMTTVIVDSFLWSGPKAWAMTRRAAEARRGGPSLTAASRIPADGRDGRGDSPAGSLQTEYSP
jgi:hypothetical protein